MEFIIASDVKNPLTGKIGAAYIYGPQKGANPKIVWAKDMRKFINTGLMQ